jgi:hypothetical protein
MEGEICRLREIVALTKRYKVHNKDSSRCHGCYFGCVKRGTTMDGPMGYVHGCVRKGVSRIKQYVSN